MCLIVIYKRLAPIKFSIEANVKLILFMPILRRSDCDRDVISDVKGGSPVTATTRLYDQLIDDRVLFGTTPKRLTGVNHDH